MNINIYNQFYNLLIFIITGIAIGILFDLFRIIRRSFKTSDLITYIEDIVFWLLAGAILLFSIFTFNNGEIRVYVFVGLIIGSLLYLLTISKYFIKINVQIITIIKNILSYPINLVIKIVKKLIIQPISYIYIKFKKIGHIFLNNKKIFKKFRKFSIKKTKDDICSRNMIK